jgi:hypothetical protein
MKIGNPPQSEAMKRILIAIFSAGWLLPLWVSASAMFQFLSAEVWPRLAGQQPLNSFPFLHFSSQAFTVACIWLASVIIFWAWRLHPQRLRKLDLVIAEKAQKPTDAKSALKSQ